jgi:hypothetical protein
MVYGLWFMVYGLWLTHTPILSHLPRAYLSL